MEADRSVKELRKSLMLCGASSDKVTADPIAMAIAIMIAIMLVIILPP